MKIVSHYYSRIVDHCEKSGYSVKAASLPQTVEEKIGQEPDFQELIDKLLTQVMKSSDMRTGMERMAHRYNVPMNKIQVAVIKSMQKLLEKKG